MYTNPAMLESIQKVEAAREANIRTDPRRMTAEEKDILLKTYHPDIHIRQPINHVFSTAEGAANKNQRNSRNG